jgi:hypothetical protein
MQRISTKPSAKKSPMKFIKSLPHSDDHVCPSADYLSMISFYSFLLHISTFFVTILLFCTKTNKTCMFSSYLRASFCAERPCASVAGSFVRSRKTQRIANLPNPESAGDPDFCVPQKTCLSDPYRASAFAQKNGAVSVDNHVSHFSGTFSCVSCKSTVQYG